MAIREEEFLDAETEDFSPQEGQKLTEWVNEPSVTNLKSDVEAATPAHNARVTKVQEWRALSKVTGKYKPKARAGRSAVQPKLVRRQAEWRYAALSEPFLGSDKLFDVKPVSFEDNPAAEQNELVLNWQWRTKIPRTKFIDNYIRSAVDEGSVIVRLGWLRQTKMVKETVPEWAHMDIQTEEELQLLQQAMELKQADPRGYDEQVPPEIKAAVDYMEESGQPTTAVQTGEVEIDVEKVLVNRPTVGIVNPENFYPDPSCEGDLDNAKFVAVTFETSKADLLKEGSRYKNLDLVNWEGETPVTNPDHETSTPGDFNFTDELRKRVVAYEYWGFYDIHGTGELVPIVATWIGSTMIRLEENPFPDGKVPFVVENYMPIKRELFGEADAELLADNQQILGALMRGMIDLLGRSANSQQGFAKGMLDALNKRRFENGQDYEYNPGTNPQIGHHEHKYPEIPQSAIGMVAMQNQEAESLTGVKAFAGGVSGEAYGDVAAGIRGALDAASKREMGILRRLANGIKVIGEKIISMNGAFLSEEEVVRVTNDEFVQIKREDLEGNFDLIVDISTAEIDNKKAQELAFMLQTMGNTVDFGLVKIVLMKIAKLQRMPELAKAIEQFNPEPDPLDVQLKELEIARAQKEIEKIQSEIDLNKAREEEVLQKANYINLQTIERETGTEHERNMEKQRGQAEGNQDLKVTEALLKPRKDGEGVPDVDAAIGFNSISKGINPPPISAASRDQAAVTDPNYSINSQNYDPALDPASNHGINV